MKYEIVRESPTTLVITAHFIEEDIETFLAESRYQDRAPVAVVAEKIVDRIVQKEGLLALSSPAVTYAKTAENAYSLSCKVETVPFIDIPEDLSSFELRFPHQEGKSEYLQHVVDQYLSQNATLESIKEKRNPIDGEILLVDICGKCDGVKVPGMCVTYKKIRLKFNAADSQPEVLDLLRNMTAGETATTSICCPDDYPDPLVRGKQISMTVVLHDIYTEHLPAFDEQLAQKKGFKNIFQLKQALFEYAARTYLQKMQQIARDELLEKIIADLVFPVPAVLHTRFLESRMKAMRQFFSSVQMEKDRLESALQRVRPEMERLAMSDARKHTFLLALGLREKLVVTTGEIENEIRRVADMSQTLYEKLHESIWNGGGINDIYEMLLAQKALDLLGKSATVIR